VDDAMQRDAILERARALATGTLGDALDAFGIPGVMSGIARRTGLGRIAGFAQTMLQQVATRNPAWTRDELILALELYLRHRERLPDSDDAEIVELSRTLNSLFGDQAEDANLFRNPNGVYMKLANFRAVDPVHTSQGKRGLSRGGHGVGEIWGNSRRALMS
jgi:hypothetical protein